MKRVSLEYKTFGDLLVVAYAGMDRANKHALYLTKCIKCGQERVCRNDVLLRGRGTCPECQKKTREPLRASHENKTFGDLRVVAYAGMDRANKHSLYLTKCVKCGRESVRRSDHLLRGRCACPECQKKTKEELREGFLRAVPTSDRAQFRYTHLRSRAWRNSIIPPQEPGASRLPFYVRWKGMMNRCYNDSNRNFPAYGGRGIFVEKVWHDAYAYNAWAVEHGLSEPGMTVDRIDVNGPYGPDNCRVIHRSMNKPERRGRKFYGIKLKTLRLMALLNCGEDAPSATTIAKRLE